MTVTTFEELEASLSDGADILINADITFTDTLTIPGDVGVTMRSTIGAVLDAAGIGRHMQIEGALTASGLTFQVSRRSAPPDHIRPAPPLYPPSPPHRSTSFHPPIRPPERQQLGQVR